MYYHKLQQIHLEPTQLCQASCPMCDRNMNGGLVNPYLKQADLSLQDIKTILLPDLLNQITLLYACGNHGDPILNQDLAHSFDYFRTTNSQLNLSVTTNGGARDADFWTHLAQTGTHVNFSIDGLHDTNHLYRQGVVWDRVEHSLDAFTQAKGSASWTFLVFKHNEHQVEEAQRFAKLFGIDQFIVKKSARYFKADGSRKYSHQAVYRGNSTTLLEEPTNPIYCNKITQKPPSGELNLKPKCLQKWEMYLSAEGLVFPCCWTAGHIYKWYMEPESSEIFTFIKDHEINAFKKPIKEIMESSFFSELIGSAEICNKKCNAAYDPFEAQWQ